MSVVPNRAPSNKTTLLALSGESLRIVALFVQIELMCLRVTVFGAWHVFLRINYARPGDPSSQRLQIFRATHMLGGVVYLLLFTSSALRL